MIVLFSSRSGSQSAVRNTHTNTLFGPDSSTRNGRLDSGDATGLFDSSSEIAPIMLANMSAAGAARFELISARRAAE